MPRAPRPDDLYRLRIATEPRLSPDGQHAVIVVQTVAPDFDGYRHALWLADTDGDAPARQLTLGAKHDRHPRYSPDGRTLAFISDRRSHVEDDPARREHERLARASGSPERAREDANQVYLLPLDGGEARRLTDLPRGVDAFEWSPDGSRLVVVSASHGATRDRGRPPSRHRAPPRARHAARLRLPLHRPARLHAQRRRVHLRQGRAPVAGRCRDRRGEAPDRRPHARLGAGLVARRPPDRLRLEPAARRRPHLRPHGHPRRRCRSRARSRPSPAARARCSRRRRGCPTGRRSRCSAIATRAGRGAATTSGCSRPTDATRRRPAGGTCPRRTT